jgi:hypothetical protein|tara:strand:- start:262 stop:531 length:270 start_codon:yes stop_codon:yes gene_type:complete
MDTIHVYKQELLQPNEKTNWTGLLDTWQNEIKSNEEIYKPLDISFDQFIGLLMNLYKRKEYEKEEIIDETGHHEILIFDYINFMEELEK